MKTETMITELKAVMEKHKNDFVPTFQTNISAMCRDIIPKLEQLAEYEKIGTIEEINDILQVISDGQDDVDESGISTGLLHTLLEYAEYAKIGTVEECREAMEKQRKKEPYIWGDGYDNEGNMIYDMYDCPNCGKSYEIDYNHFQYCPECGQRLNLQNV